MSAHEYPDSPQIAVGVIVIRDDKVLLVRRGQPPGEGLWAVPGGSVELGETLKEAAERMGRSPEAVKKLFWRALKELRTIMTDTASLHLPDRELEREEGHDVE